MFEKVTYSMYSCRFETAKLRENDVKIIDFDCVPKLLKIGYASRNLKSKMEIIILV